MADIAAPIKGPADGFYEPPRLTERKVDPGDPWARPLQRLFKKREFTPLLEFFGVKQPVGKRAFEAGDGFPPRWSAGEINAVDLHRCVHRSGGDDAVSCTCELMCANSAAKAIRGLPQAAEPPVSKNARAWDACVRRRSSTRALLAKSVATDRTKAIGPAACSIASAGRAEAIGSPAIAVVVASGAEAVGAKSCSVTTTRGPEAISSPAVAMVVAGGAEAVGAVRGAVTAPGGAEAAGSTGQTLGFRRTWH